MCLQDKHPYNLAENLNCENFDSKKSNLETGPGLGIIIDLNTKNGNLNKLGRFITHSNNICVYSIKWPSLFIEIKVVKAPIMETSTYFAEITNLEVLQVEITDNTC